MKNFFFILIFLLLNNSLYANENVMILELKNGKVEIELYPDIAPKHVERFKTLAKEGKYNGVVFHRVIDKFMAQTGDVQFGNSLTKDYNLGRAGTGGSTYPDLKAEFSSLPHERGTLAMARSSSPDSANSQFFICFASQPHLDNNYTVFGKVINGMEFVDQIKKGDPQSGAIDNPDIIVSLKSSD